MTGIGSAIPDRVPSPTQMGLYRASARSEGLSPFGARRDCQRFRAQVVSQARLSRLLEGSGWGSAHCSSHRSGKGQDIASDIAAAGFAVVTASRSA